MTGLEHMQVHMSRGDGLVARFPSLLLVVPTMTGRHDRAVAQLLELCRSAGAAPAGKKVARQLAGLLATEEPADVPPFAVLAADASDTTVVFICGDVDVELRAAGAESSRLTGHDSVTWVDRLVRGSDGFTVTAHGLDGVADYDPRTDLQAGVVPGGGVRLVPRAAPASPPAAVASPDEESDPETEDRWWSDGDETAAAEEETAFVGLGGEEPALQGTARASRPSRGAAGYQPIGLTEPAEDEAREPVPVRTDAPDRTVPPRAAPDADQRRVQVDGVLCPLRHLNDPRSLFCNSCGRNLVHVTHQPVRGVRPPLGLLVLDDGSIYTLDDDYILGREPERDARVAKGEMRPLRVTDPDGTVSRVHAEVILQDWDVLIADNGSANGTYVAAPLSEDWRAVAVGSKVSLRPGARLRVGERTFQFESPLHL